MGRLIPDGSTDIKFSLVVTGKQPEDPTMPNRSREKGNRFEYECRDIAIENGLNCKKVPLSGACPDAPGDLEIEGLLYQCKVKRKMPAWAVPAEAEVGVIFKEDRGEISIKIPYTKFCQYLACWHGKYMEES